MDKLNRMHRIIMAIIILACPVGTHLVFYSIHLKFHCIPMHHIFIQVLHKINLKFLDENEHSLEMSSSYHNKNMFMIFQNQKSNNSFFAC